MPEVASSIYSYLATWLPRLQRFNRFPGLRSIYYRLFAAYEDGTKPVRTRVHGFEVLLNPGNNYPFILHSHPLFNAPLVELVHQVHVLIGRPITVLDVGAATGDTVVLLKERCPGAVRQFLCIEGDVEFFNLLTHNVAQFKDVQAVRALLAREPQQIRSLVKHHRGTAAALGSELVAAVRLDSLAQVSQEKVDVVKIDVDGFDGEVLAGAAQIFETRRPAVIFEWHPVLIRRTGNDVYRPFSALMGYGYDRFLWFNNIGTFSHFSGPPTVDMIDKHANYLVQVNPRADEHFDVIALPAGSQLDEVKFACMDFARGAFVNKHPRRRKLPGI